MLALAVTAGMLGAVNPCGFALLPAYLSVMVAGDRPGGSVAAVGRALRCAVLLTLGYVLVFGAFGLVLTPIEDLLQPRLPWLTVVLGIGLALAGGWLLAGRSLPRLGGGLRAPRLTGSAWSTVAFGMAYACASLGCASGPFLAIVVAGTRTGSSVEGLGLFLAYGAGMSLVISVAAVAVALVRGSVISRLRRASAVAPRISGAVLVVTGCYVAWYGVYELRVATDRRAAGTDPVVAAAGRMQEALASFVGSAGALWLLAALTVLAAAALLATRRRATGHEAVVDPGGISRPDAALSHHSPDVAS
ncbi:cytochrome c biogenesis CcdA family protein [Actinoplanes sp. NBRC 103695]|uniref:cytochrome c biogenesis CcdA family protein n=1 Tax=Actinoplanes sp. NBRC 103695 TaxID=3032202 RepID=UPI0024A21834|nr:cytochrome c biogenesis CcdA family protein [Actinoplanes sp. NBRC 103695]GLY98547.1 cytochrome C biogenesis protein CcdA [Actinoplanes sp. NBRC 103695]